MTKLNNSMIIIMKMGKLISLVMLMKKKKTHLSMKQTKIFLIIKKLMKKKRSASEDVAGAQH